TGSSSTSAQKTICSADLFVARVSWWMRTVRVYGGLPHRHGKTGKDEVKRDAERRRDRFRASAAGRATARRGATTGGCFFSGVRRLAAGASLDGQADRPGPPARFGALG